MTNHRRSLLLILAASTAALSEPVDAAVTQSATVKVTVVKPLTLTALQNLDLGTITLNSGTWSNVTVGISSTGTFSCPAGNVVCTGAPQAAQFKVTGTNRQVVTISAPNVTLTDQADSSKTLTVVLDAPPNVTLTSSGEPGVNFNVGGSVVLSSTTADGTYTGTMNVTVDYQ
jgi:spore coat protein U-like protein